MKWTRDDTCKFVELFQNHDCLWNMTKAEYKNRSMRQKAIEDILQVMRREGFGVAEVKQKIKNIRSTYNQELLKIKKSARSATCLDSIYQPTVKWFSIMDQIMKATKKPTDIGTRSKPSNSESIVDSQDVPDVENEEIQETERIIDRPNKTVEEQHKSFQQPHKKILMRRSREVNHPILLTAKEPRGTKRHSHKMSRAATLNEVQRSESPMQENEAFSRYVASALNKLPQQEAIMAQNEIQNILTRYRLSVIPTPSNCMSFTPSSHKSSVSSNHSSESYMLTNSYSQPPSSNTLFTNNEQEVENKDEIYWKHEKTALLK